MHTKTHLILCRLLHQLQYMYSKFKLAKPGSTIRLGYKLRYCTTYIFEFTPHWAGASNFLWTNTSVEWLERREQHRKTHHTNTRENVLFTPEFMLCSPEMGFAAGTTFFLATETFNCCIVDFSRMLLPSWHFCRNSDIFTVMCHSHLNVNIMTTELINMIL